MNKESSKIDTGKLVFDGAKQRAFPHQLFAVLSLIAAVFMYYLHQSKTEGLFYLNIYPTLVALATAMFFFGLFYYSLKTLNTKDFFGPRIFENGIQLNYANGMQIFIPFIEIRKIDFLLFGFLPKIKSQNGNFFIPGQHGEALAHLKRKNIPIAPMFGLGSTLTILCATAILADDTGNVSAGLYFIFIIYKFWYLLWGTPKLLPQTMNHELILQKQKNNKLWALAIWPGIISIVFLKGTFNDTGNFYRISTPDQEYVKAIQIEKSDRPRAIEMMLALNKKVNVPFYKKEAARMITTNPLATPEELALAESWFRELSADLPASFSVQKFSVNYACNLLALGRAEEAMHVWSSSNKNRKIVPLENQVDCHGRPISGRAVASEIKHSYPLTNANQ